MPAALVSRGFRVEPILGGEAARTASRSERVHWIGFAAAGAVVQPEPPGPEPTPPGGGVLPSGPSVGRRGPGKGPGPRRIPWIPTVIFGEGEESLWIDRCDDDVPLCAAFAVTERASPLEQHKRLVFALVWRMRKPRG